MSHDCHDSKMSHDAHDTGILASAGHVAQEIKDVTTEKLYNAGAAVKDTIASGVEKVAGTAQENYDAAGRKLDQAGNKLEEQKDHLGRKGRRGYDF
ncbi:toxin-antitoxin system, toxin component, PIN domain protein [Cooperia oncophora]